MIEHQFKRYVKSLGRDPGSLTEAEEKELMNRMVRDLYPGQVTPKRPTKKQSYSVISGPIILLQFYVRILLDP